MLKHGHESGKDLASEVERLCKKMDEENKVRVYVWNGVMNYRLRS